MMTSCDFVEYWQDVRPLRMPPEPPPPGPPSLSTLLARVLADPSFIPFERLAMLDKDGESVLQAVAHSAIADPTKPNAVVISGLFRAYGTSGLYAIAGISSTGEITYLRDVEPMYLVNGDTVNFSITITTRL